MKKNILEEALRKQIREILSEEVMLEQPFPGLARPPRKGERNIPAKAAPAKAAPAKAAPAKAAPAKKAPKKARKKKSRYRDIDYVQAVSDIANKYGEGISIFEDPSQGLYRDLERETYDKKLKKSVIKLQKKLGLRGREVDGWFGPKTACVLKMSSFVKRFKYKINVGCFKKEWVMKLADYLREEEQANARKGASKSKPKKAKASFNAYYNQFMRWKKRISRIQILAMNGIHKVTDFGVRSELSEIRASLERLKRKAVADNKLENRESLIQQISDEIIVVDDMLKDPSNYDSSIKPRGYKTAKKSKIKESKFSNDKELQNLMESFKKFTRND